jgi:hypothetical protein
MRQWWCYYAHCAANASRHFPDSSKLAITGFYFHLVPVPNPSKSAGHSNPAKNLPFESG